MKHKTMVMKIKFLYCSWLLLLLFSCKVVFISGYDAVIDETTTQIKKDFNLHFLKLARKIQDTDAANQRFENFIDYYDHLEVNLMLIKDRSSYLEGKSLIVKQQIQNLDSVMNSFVRMHKNGIPDRPDDDRRDIKNAINSSLDAVIKLQEQLKSTGKTKPEN